MDFSMDIAAMSVNMHSVQTSQELGLSVLKLAMESQSAAMENMLEAIDVSSMTGIGGNLDIMA